MSRYVTGGRLSCACHEGIWGCGGIALLIRELALEADNEVGCVPVLD
jgi:hypothetical protein